MTIALDTLFSGDLIRLSADGTTLKEAMVRWSEDAEYARLLDSGAAVPRTLVEIERDQADDDEESYNFAIHTLTDDKLIGFCNLWPVWNHQNAWVGIGIGEPEYRGKGYGTDAMRVVTSYGFRELGLYRVSLSVFSYNARAIRSYEKAGFIREQVQRAALFRDGQRYDLYVMGLLRPEWEAQREAQQAAR